MTMVTETHQQTILQLGGRRREPQPRPGLMTRKMASAGLRSWGEAAAAAKNRINWKKLGESVVETLCGTRHSAK